MLRARRIFCCRHSGSSVRLRRCFGAAGDLGGALASREGAPRWITLFTVVQIAIAMAIPHWLNLRYVSVAFGCYCLVAGLGFWFVVSLFLNRIKAADRKALVALLGLVAVGGAIADYARFER